MANNNQATTENQTNNETAGQTQGQSENAANEAAKKRECPFNVWHAKNFKPFKIGNGYIDVYPQFEIVAADAGKTPEDWALEKYGEAKIEALKTAEMYDDVIAMIRRELDAAKSPATIPAEVTAEDLRKFPAVRFYPAMMRFDLQVVTVPSISQDMAELLADFAGLIKRRMDNTDFPVNWTMETLAAMLRITGCRELQKIEGSDKETKETAEKRRAELLADYGATKESLADLPKLADHIDREFKKGTPQARFSVAAETDSNTEYTETIRKNPRPAGTEGEKKTE